MRIILDMSEHDFEGICTTSMKWGPGWTEQSYRFEPLAKDYTEDPGFDWKMVYWAGDARVNVIFMQSMHCLYLTSHHLDIQALQCPTMSTILACTSALSQCN